MNWLIDYRNNVLRTVAPLDRGLHIAHMNAGILTEFAEVVDLYKKHIAYGKDLDMSKVAEEWADLMFYLMGKLDKDPDVKFIEALLYSKNPQVQEDKVKMLEFLLSHVDIDLRLARDTHRYLNAAIAEWIAVAFMLQIDAKDACDKNIAKLKVRFPDRFDADKAINRNVDEEKKVL